MGLSDDQKAILRLLSQRGEAGYEDLSALMGISAQEVYARAKGAAAQLEAEGIPAPAIPEPSGAVAAGGDSSAESSPKKRLPAEESPPAPPKPKPEPVALPKGPPKPPLKKELKLLENRGLWAILAGVAILVIFLVIVLTSGGSDSGSNSETTTAAGNVTEKAVEALEKSASKTGKQVTKAVLNPVDGSNASGVAVFGRVKNKLALQVYAEGLNETESGEGYTIWLAASETKMLPLASTPVGKSGKISAQVEVPVEILAYLANETFGQIAITRTDESQLKASLAKATKEKKAPVYTGTEVLRGTVTGPIVGAAQRIEEAGK